MRGWCRETLDHWIRGRRCAEYPTCEGEAQVEGSCRIKLEFGVDGASIYSSHQSPLLLLCSCVFECFAGPAPLYKPC